MLYEATFDIIKGREKHRFSKENRNPLVNILRGGLLLIQSSDGLK